MPHNNLNQWWQIFLTHILITTSSWFKWKIEASVLHFSNTHLSKSSTKWNVFIVMIISHFQDYQVAEYLKQLTFIPFQNALIMYTVLSQLNDFDDNLHGLIGYHYNGCIYLSMPGLKLIMLLKRGLRWNIPSEHGQHHDLRCLYCHVISSHDVLYVEYVFSHGDVITLKCIGIHWWLVDSLHKRPAM